jgi:hypothetical protein
MPLISFATGRLWNVSNNKDFLSKIKKFDVDGIEITLGKRFGHRVIPKKYFKWLKSKKCVTIHAPFKMVRIAESDEKLFAQFKAIEKSYKSVNAKSLITHPYEVPSKKIRKKLKMNFLVENMEKRRWKKRLEFEKILEKNPEIGMCLDVSHTYTCSPKETGRIIKKWKYRIKQVHFSNCYRSMCHAGFRKVTPGFLKSIEPLRELNVPIVLEIDMVRNDFRKIKKEIEAAKKVLLKIYVH